MKKLTVFLAVTVIALICATGIIIGAASLVSKVEARYQEHVEAIAKGVE